MEGHTRRAIIHASLLTAAVPRIALAGPDPVRIGMVLSLSGPYASLGVPQQNTITLFPQIIGGRPLQIQVEDDASDADLAEKACRKLVGGRGVDILFGTTVTPTSLPAIKVAGGSETPMISFAASSAVIEPQEGDRRWLFKPAPADRFTTDPLVAHMAANGVATFATIAFSTAYGDGLVASILTRTAERNLRSLTIERFSPAAASVEPEVRRILQQCPDAVFVAASGTPGVLPFVELRKAGFKGPIYTTGGIANPDALRVGGSALEGVLLTLSPVLLPEQLDDTNPVKAAALAYVNAYEGQFGPGSRSLFGATAWDAFAMLERCLPEALAEAQPGTRAFRSSLRNGLERLQGFVGAEGIFNLSPRDHSGSGPSSQVMATIKGGTWWLLGS